MSFHHRNRLAAHFDLATISPEHRLVAIQLASDINHRWLSFSPSEEQLQSETGITDPEQVKALAADLVDIGLFEVVPLRNKPGRYGFIMALKCPAECRNNSHSTPKERDLWGVIPSEPKPKTERKTEVSLIEKMSIEKKQKPIENKTLDDETFLAVISDLEPETRARYQLHLKASLEKAQALVKAREPGNVAAYLRSTLENDPEKFLPKFEADSYSDSLPSDEEMRETLSALFSQLGIDYAEEVEATTMERKLRPAFYAGNLDIRKCWLIWNEWQPESKQLALPDGVNLF